MMSDPIPGARPAHRLLRSGAATWLAVVGLAVGGGAASGQAVVGRVMDADTGDRIAAAQVSLLRDSARIRTALTDSAGEFAVPVLEPDTYALRVEHVAYEVVVSRPFHVGQDDVVEVELRMSQRGIPLQPLVVTARRGAGNARLSEFYRRLERNEDLGKGVILSRAELERYETYTVREVLGRNGVVFRRTNPFMACMIRTYWNGMMIESVPDDRWSGAALRDLPVSAIEGVEIYRDRFDIPAEYRNPEVCGVILAWSRPIRPGEGSRDSPLIRLLAAVGIFALLTLIAR